MSVTVYCQREDFDKITSQSKNLSICIKYINMKASYSYFDLEEYLCQCLNTFQYPTIASHFTDTDLVFNWFCENAEFILINKLYDTWFLQLMKHQA